MSLEEVLFIKQARRFPNIYLREELIMVGKQDSLVVLWVV